MSSHAKPDRGAADTPRAVPPPRMPTSDVPNMFKCQCAQSDLSGQVSQRCAHTLPGSDPRRATCLQHPFPDVRRRVNRFPQGVEVLSESEPCPLVERRRLEDPPPYSPPLSVTAAAAAAITTLSRGRETNVTCHPDYEGWKGRGRCGAIAARDEASDPVLC